jgi:hypothetical protein
VDDALAVGVRQGTGDVGGVAERLADRDARRLLPDEAGEVLAMQQLGDDEHPPVGLVNVVDNGDARVAQGGGGFRLAAEPLDAGRARVGVQHDLDRDLPAEAQVAAAPDLAHATASQPSAHVVPPGQHGPRFHVGSPAQSVREAGGQRPALAGLLRAVGASCPPGAG